MSRPIVVLDACVLYPQMLRDVLVSLACADLFQAKWSHRINEEWSVRLLERNPGRENQIARTLELLNLSVEDCLVHDYEDLIDQLSLPDPDDRHVLAVAIRGKADRIITTNRSDFPASVLERHGIIAQSPDDFLVSLIDQDVHRVCAALATLRSRYRKPAMTVDEFLDSLARKRLERTAKTLETHAGSL